MNPRRAAMTEEPPAPAGLPAVDPLEQMARDDRADWELLRLVLCVAVAILALAAASTLPL